MGGASKVGACVRRDSWVKIAPHLCHAARAVLRTGTARTASAFAMQGGVAPTALTWFLASLLIATAAVCACWALATATKAGQARRVSWRCRVRMTVATVAPAMKASVSVTLGLQVLTVRLEAILKLKCLVRNAHRTAAGMVRAMTGSAFVI